MTPLPSRATVVKGYLADQLPAAMPTPEDPLHPVLVVYSPAGDAADVELVELGKVTLNQEWANLGATNRDEFGQIDFAVWVHHQGWDQRQVEERSALILASIELYVRGDISLGGNVLFAGVVPTELLPGMEDAGRVARFGGEIHYQARI